MQKFAHTQMQRADVKKSWYLLQFENNFHQKNYNTIWIIQHCLHLSQNRCCALRFLSRGAIKGVPGGTLIQFPPAMRCFFHTITSFLMCSWGDDCPNPNRWGNLCQNVYFLWCFHHQMKWSRCVVLCRKYDILVGAHTVAHNNIHLETCTHTLSWIQTISSSLCQFF